MNGYKLLNKLPGWFQRFIACKALKGDSLCVLVKFHRGKHYSPGDQWAEEVEWL
jgi:hypothetical protein